MALGYAGHAEWRDMSEYLVHMTRGRAGLASILTDRRVRAVNPYGAARKSAGLGSTQRVVCLSEIPVDRLDRLAEKRGVFGVAFDRKRLMGRGAVPVWYLPKGVDAQTALFGEVKRLAWNQVPDPDHWLWKLTPFIDYPGTYDRDARQVTYDWTWEREWRICGDLAFRPTEVEFLFAPDETHSGLEHDWLDLTDVPCPPMIDPTWPIERVQTVAIGRDL
jgi:hypothetical protein